MDTVQLEVDAFPSVVLIVDRDETVSGSYCALFESAGWWASTCTAPLDGVEAIRDLRPDLLVTAEFGDVEFDLVGSLKAHERTRQIPIILLAERTTQSLAAGLVDLCLRKPVPAERLLASSQSVLERSRERRERREQPDGPAATLAQTHRACPRCGLALGWIERTRLLGIEYDYYHWCTNGCGLYCYEIRAERWVKIV